MSPRGSGKLENPRSDAEQVATAPLSRRCLELVERSRLANLLAGQALRPQDPLPFGGASTVACELSRQAVYWALCAHRELAGGTGEASSVRAPLTLPELWGASDAGLLERAATNAATAAAVKVACVDQSFIDFAEQPSASQIELAASLSAFAERLVEPLDAPRRAQERAWARRIEILIAACLLILGLGFGVEHWLKADALNADMAPSAKWTTSSVYHRECSCPSPQQECAKCPAFFFHTSDDDSPWVLFDLHRVRTLSAVLVENRSGCCEERAAPLVVEVSTDNKTWNRVAERSTTFDVWRADFSRVDARWVRLSVPRKTYLHLKRVRLFP